MKKRHSSNKNLRLIYSEIRNGHFLQTKQGPACENYLERIEQVVDDALAAHHRTVVLRVDLRFPDERIYTDSSVITRFFSSLKSQIRADTIRKMNENIKVHHTELRYIWVKEFGLTGKPHYHLAILLNKDRFNSFGKIKSSSDYSSLGLETINMADRIRKAWVSALKIDYLSGIGLVHFSGCPMILDKNALDFKLQYSRLITRLSYLAKAASKVYGNGSRCFGASAIGGLSPFALSLDDPE